MCICINVFSVPFVCAQTAPGEACGYLWYRNPEGNQCVPWVPQEGDIVLMSHRGERQSWVYHIGRSGHPFHAALIIRQATGNLTMLEAGGSEDMRVTQLPIGYRMGKYFQYHDSPVAWVRRIKRPVTPEQSVRMARFGNTQLGKPFASAWRMWPMVLPTRPMPSTRPDQSSWYCSELVLETLFTAG